MRTRLIEFAGDRPETLRGILTEPDVADGRLVLMAGGFERAATTERKFKLLADRLAALGIASLRYDTADVGLSDGDFRSLTVAGLSRELAAAARQAAALGYRRVSACVHSLGACVLAESLAGFVPERVVLLAPAFNQRDLQRYWFVRRSRPDEEIGWTDFRAQLDEPSFLRAAGSETPAKTHVVGPDYCGQTKDVDYADLFRRFPAERVLLVHGAADDTVPLASLNIGFPRELILEKGDHDLEKPAVIGEWLDPAAEFLAGE